MYQNYRDFIQYLLSLQDLKYKEFHQKLTFTKYEIIGIRVPVLRKIAKEIAKNYSEDFLKCLGDKYYEEVFLEGLVIASLPEDKLLKYLPKYVNKIDNWAICDSFCNSLTIVKKDYQKYFEYFKEYLKSSKEFTVRVALVVLLNFYVNENYIEEIFKLVDEIKLDKYYVNMAVAWLLAECYIKYPDKTVNYLKVAKINNFTFNKTISKISDSYRVTKEEKEKLKKMRR